MSQSFEKWQKKFPLSEENRQQLETCCRETAANNHRRPPSFHEGVVAYWSPRRGWVFEALYWGRRPTPDRGGFAVFAKATLRKAADALRGGRGSRRKTVEMRNLTPHELKIRLVEGSKTLPTVGNARISVREEEIGNLAGIPIRRQVFGAVEGLPDSQEGIRFVVSALVRAAVPHRTDVFSPDTGKSAVRENGQIVAVTGLISN